MKIILVLIMVISFNLEINSQIQMDVKQMTLSGIYRDSNRKIITNGNDSILIDTEDIYNLPAITAIIEIKNISDTSICLFANNSKMFVSYQYREKKYINELTTIVKNNNFIAVPNNIELSPNKVLILDTQGEIIREESFLSRELSKVKDFNLFLIEILPTLKFSYRDEKGTLFTQNEILKVIVDDNL